MRKSTKLSHEEWLERIITKEGRLNAKLKQGE